jgi:hypothetical protein
MPELSYRNSTCLTACRDLPVGLARTTLSVSPPGKIIATRGHRTDATVMEAVGRMHVLFHDPQSWPVDLRKQQQVAIVYLGIKQHKSDALHKHALHGASIDHDSRLCFGNMVPEVYPETARLGLTRSDLSWGTHL